MKIRLFAFLFVLGLTVIAAITGNVLESRGILTREDLGSGGLHAVMGLFFGLFCLLCLSIVPLAVRLFLDGQDKIGNGKRLIVKSIREHENTVVVAFWAVFLLGLAIIYALAGDQVMKDLM